MYALLLCSCKSQSICLALNLPPSCPAPPLASLPHRCPALPPAAATTGMAGVLGAHMTASIGGADMPVVITLLNSYRWAGGLVGAGSRGMRQRGQQAGWDRAGGQWRGAVAPVLREVWPV